MSRAGDLAGGGAERWLSIHDELLRALAHAVSNRLATIAAAASMLEAGGVPDPRVLEAVRVDAERLEGLLQQLRQLPRRAEVALEPMLVTDALEGAKQLIAEHPLLRGRSIRTALRGDVMPVRADPTAMIHATGVALLAAARLGDGPIDAELATDGDVVRLTARCGAAPDSEDPLLPLDAMAIDWLLAESHGRAAVETDGCAFAVPTLQASRRR